jgi:hypothetical protein
MNYTLPWFEKPETLYHSQGSQLDAETLYEDLRSEKCRITLIYARETRSWYGARTADGTRAKYEASRPTQFEFQALVLRKFVDTEEVATDNCWYERAGGIHHHISVSPDPDLDPDLSSDSIDSEEDERFLSWLKGLFENPDYERVEIR